MMIMEFDSAENFLVWAEPKDGRFELRDGKAHTMGKSTRNHGVISVNVSVALHHRLSDDGPYEAFGPDLFLTADGQNVFLPDASARTLEGDPVAIFEIVSPASAAHDLGDKAQLYRAMPSVRHLVFIAEDEISVTHYHRVELGDFKIFELKTQDSALNLDAIGVQMLVSEVYHRVRIR